MVRPGEAKRTVSFFRLVVETPDRNIARVPAADWQAFLGRVRRLDIKGRTWTSPTRRLIGEVLSVDGEYALKLMEPRDENSWLELLRQESQGSPDAGETAAEAVDLRSLGDLVETSVAAFLPGQANMFGIIRGSTSSPTHTALAEWLDHATVDGRTIVPTGQGVLRAEPALSREQRRKLDASSGVSKASVRVSTTRAPALRDAGSVDIADALDALKRTYGHLIVTISLRIPRGKEHDEARSQLREETMRLNEIVRDAEAVSATLVTYDPEQRSHSEDVDFVAQRVTQKTLVALTGEDGQPIRNESAVRAILAAAADRRSELAAEE